MIDSIHLQTENFRLACKRDFSVQANPQYAHLNVFLGLDPNLRPINGISAYASWTPNESHRTKIDFEITTRQYRKFLTIKVASLPRLCYVHNIFPLDRREELVSAMSRLKEIADGLGVEVFDWNEMRITRMDVSGTFITRQRAQKYVDIVKTGKLRGKSTVIRKDGVEFHSKNAVFAVYDKFAQMRQINEYFSNDYQFYWDSEKSREAISTDLVQNHLLRIEFKYKNFDSIKANFDKIRSWGDISNGLSEIYEVYFRSMIKILNHIDGTATKELAAKRRKTSPTGVISTTPIQAEEASKVYEDDQLAKLLKQIIEEYPDDWYRQLISDFGYASLLKEFGSSVFNAVYENIRKLPKYGDRANSASQQISRMKTSAKEAKGRYDRYIEILEPKRKTPNLIEELKTALSRYQTVIFEHWKTQTKWKGSTDTIDHVVTQTILDPNEKRITDIVTDEDFGQLNSQMEKDFSSYIFLVRVKLPLGEAGRLQELKFAKFGGTYPSENRVS